MGITPFNAKMDADQFMVMAQSFRDRGQTLPQSYENCETVHQAFYNQTRFPTFEAFKRWYYANHPARQD